MNNLYFSTTGATQYHVYYQPGMDGGGTWFGQEYSDIIAARYADRVFANCLEWCAGPAFIGYNILDHGLCQHLTLLEIHALTVAQAERSRVDPHNSCSDQVTIYNSGTMSDIPAHSQFDLIVGNPPHFPHASTDPEVSRIESDDGWQIHQEFFANVKNRLSPNGVILLQENMIGSTVDTFDLYIKQAGLELRDWFVSPNWFRHPTDDCQIYYMEIVSA